MHSWTRIVCALAMLICAEVATARQSQSAFTYQGRLKLAGVPVTDTCDLRVSLWNAASGGLQLAGPQEFLGVAVDKGLFVITPDFGFDIWDGDARFLQIAVRCPAGGPPGVGYTTLAPRQPMTAVPYALFAQQGGEWTLGAQGLSYEGGRVGIGTASPGSLLHVQQSADDHDEGLWITNTSANRALEMWVDSSSRGRIQVGVNADSPLLLNPGGTGNVGIGVIGTAERLDVGGGVLVDAFGQNFGALSIGLKFGTYDTGEGIASRRTSPSQPDWHGLSFFTNSTRRMLITQGGQASIGMDPYSTAKLSVYAPTTNDTALFLGGAVVCDKNLLIQPGTGDSGNGSVVVAPFAGYGLQVGGAAGSGNLLIFGQAYKPTGSLWEPTSDRRIKVDIEPVTNALEQVHAIRAVDFRYSPEWCERYGVDANTTFTGVIAQEFAEAYPQFVHEGPFDLPDGSGKALVVDTSNLPFIAIAAVQELDAKNAALEATVAAQAQELAELKSRLERIEALLSKSTGR